MSNQLEFEPALSNFLDDGFSNAKGKAARKEKRKIKKDMKAVCGRKPLLKKKQGAWQKCVDEAKANGAPTSSADVASKTDASSTTPPDTTTDATKDTTSTTAAAPSTTDANAGDTNAAATVADTGDGGDKGNDKGNGKILGISKPVFFIGLAVVAVGGFFAVRSMMGKGASAPTT